jgi:serine/threonine-protein kinase
MKPPDTPADAEVPLSPERWAHVRALVEEALTVPPDARAAFLHASCGGDEALRRRIERLAAACERDGESWGFLAHPAGALVAPLLAASTDPHAGDRLATIGSTLAGRYRLERELGVGGMATVYLAHDVRHERQVAVKVLHPALSAALGAERFLSEIRTTAALQHAHILPLFDSGASDGFLFYVMPLVDGETLRARLTREPQLPVDDAVRIATDVAGALDYAHRRGVVHRDVKPENILLHEGRPLIADFGIAIAVQSAGVPRMTQPGTSLGTPPYMSPEQAAGSALIDGRSDVYSLACVLYESLVGDPPFTGRSAQVVLARVLAETPTRVRMLRPSVPAHVDAALARALAKLPADRHASAREFAEALVADASLATSAPPPAVPHARATWRRGPMRLAMGGAAVIGLAVAAWMARRLPDAPTYFVYDDLIDQTPGSTVSITPDGRALVYTGSGAGSRAIMLRRVGQLAARAVAGTEGGSRPLVAPGGQRLAFYASDGRLQTASLEDVAAAERPNAWRYGSGGWIGDRAIVSERAASSRGLATHVPGDSAPTELTRPDTARGESRHAAPLLIADGRAMVFTVGRCAGPEVGTGQLAIASFGAGGTRSPAPHVLLDVRARRAIAFVDGWLLYVSADGAAIMAVRLDVEGRRVRGNPVRVLTDSVGNVETASLADNGTLLYVRRPRANAPVFVDASGAVHPPLEGGEGSFMYPRISPDGKRFAVQVTSACGEDVWVYDIASRTAARLTTTGGALHPTWTPDGRRIVVMRGEKRGLLSLPVDGGTAADTLPGTVDAFAPTVAPNGRLVLFQRPPAHPAHPGHTWSIWSATLQGEGAPRRILDDQFVNFMPTVSPDGRALAYVSDATGRREVYARRFSGSGAAVQVSDGGGTEPAWSPDGRRIYYLGPKGTLMAAAATRSLVITSRTRLFQGTFSGGMPHRNYDVAPDGTGFLMIAPGARPDAVVVLDWLPELRARLASAR